MNVLGAGAGVECCWAKPVDPSGEVSCESQGGRSSNNTSSVPRRLELEGVWAYLDWLLRRGHCYVYKLEVCGWVGLEVWGQDLSVFVGVELEGIALPPAHGLDDVEWDASEQVFECASNAEAMAFKVGEIVGDGNVFDPLNNFAFGERGKGFSMFGFVSKDVSIWRRGIDLLVVLEGFPWVSWTWLLCPGSWLALLLG